MTYSTQATFGRRTKQKHRTRQAGRQADSPLPWHQNKTKQTRQAKPKQDMREPSTDPKRRNILPPTSFTRAQLSHSHTSARVKWGGWGGVGGERWEGGRLLHRRGVLLTVLTAWALHARVFFGPSLFDYNGGCRQRAGLSRTEWGATTTPREFPDRQWRPKRDRPAATVDTRASVFLRNSSLAHSTACTRCHISS